MLDKLIATFKKMGKSRSNYPTSASWISNQYQPCNGCSSMTIKITSALFTLSLTQSKLGASDVLTLPCWGPTCGLESGLQLELT